MAADKIAVIGGGAAGLMAAVSAARRGARVTVFEHNDRVGKKLLATGNGRCNYTNMNMAPDYYGTRKPGQVKKVLDCFPPEKAVALLEQLGICPRYRGSLVYPNSDQASSVLDCFRTACTGLGVCFRTDSHVSAVMPAPGKRTGGEGTGGSLRDKETAGWLVTAGGRTYPFDRVILAAGSKASDIPGADGSGYVLAQKTGHALVPVYPALVQLTSGDPFLKGLAGVRCQGTVSLCIDGRVVAEDTGEVQLTQYGVSGIPAFQVSRQAAPALEQGRRVTVLLNFLPQWDREEAAAYLDRRAEGMRACTLEEYFSGLLNKKLSSAIIRRVGLKAAAPAAEWSRYRQQLFRQITAFTVHITGTRGFSAAQVCSGGVDLGQVNCPSMESRLHAGLYFAGEILDADGLCGGYNLHWAWATGYLAGTHSARKG